MTCGWSDPPTIHWNGIDVLKLIHLRQIASTLMCGGVRTSHWRDANVEPSGYASRRSNEAPLRETSRDLMKAD